MAQAQVNVMQEHSHISRHGLYIDSAFTRTAAANLRRDLNFNGTDSLDYRRHENPHNPYFEQLFRPALPGGILPFQRLGGECASFA
jgi:hypothetical protein